MFPGVNVVLSCFKQPSLKFTLFLLPKQFNAGARLLTDVVGGLILSLDNPLDFHDEIGPVVWPTFLKYLCIVWNSK